LCGDGGAQFDHVHTAPENAGQGRRKKEREREREREREKERKREREKNMPRKARVHPCLLHVAVGVEDLLVFEPHPTRILRILKMFHR
jgi:hypothetical protein